MAAPFPQTGLTVSAARPAAAGAGLAGGNVHLMLRIEGFAALAAALALYSRGGFSWPAFAALFLVPDLAMLGISRRTAMGRLWLQSRPHLRVAACPRARGLCGGFAVRRGLRADLDRPYRIGPRARLRPEISDRFRRHASRPCRLCAPLTRRPDRNEDIMRIHAITTGRVRIKQAQIEGRGHGLWRQLQPILSRQWADWSPVYAFAIEHPEGVIVVDTGSNAGLKSLPLWHPFFQLGVRFDIEPGQELGPQLKTLGIGARDVRTVVLTHLHIDHDGGLAHFPAQPDPRRRRRDCAGGRHPRRIAGLSPEPMAEVVSARAAGVATDPLRAVRAQRPADRCGRRRSGADAGSHAEPSLGRCLGRRTADRARRRRVLS